jgi:hypothetical protein
LKILLDSALFAIFRIKLRTAIKPNIPQVCQALVSSKNNSISPNSKKKLQNTRIGAIDDDGRFLRKNFIPKNASVANAAALVMSK